MKVGSKVVCIKKPKPTSDGHKKMTLPVMNGEYTIREIKKIGECAGVLLEEIVNPKMLTTAGFREVLFCSTHFRELNQTPDLSETTYEDIMQEIEQTELTPQTA